MVNLGYAIRLSNVLVPSQLPCLKKRLTINITQGCAHNCVYCYARGYRNAPPDNEIYIYENVVEKLTAELTKRIQRGVKPDYVYFSSSADAFQPIPQVQEITYSLMQVLFKHNVGVRVLTKGEIGNPFYELFKKYKELVHIDIGLSSLDEKFHHYFEPRTAPPTKRLDMLKKLKKLNVSVNVRIDPIIPNITDEIAQLENLFKELSNLEIKKCTVSYLMIRPKIANNMYRLLPLSVWMPIYEAFSDREKHYIACSANTWVLSKKQLIYRYNIIKEIADTYGVTLVICRCKNPNLEEASYCSIAEPTDNETNETIMLKRTTEPKQLYLFHS